MRSARSNNRQSRVRSTAPYRMSGTNAAARGTRVYVGNLSWAVQWQDLKDHMRQAGNVVRCDVMEETNGRSKGCALVEFATPHEAQSAIATMNDSELDGRLIFVREDREGGGGGGGGGGDRGDRGGGHQSEAIATRGSVVYVGNLSWQVKWQDLKDHFKQCGLVVRADVLEEHDGRSKGCGLVEFSSPQEAHEAIQSLNDSELMGRLIFVREDRVGNGGASTREHVQSSRDVQFAGSQDGLNMGYPAALATERAAPVGSHNEGGTVSKRLYVGNLAWGVRWQDLKDHFKALLPSVGGFRADVIMESGQSNRSKGFGIVEFDTIHDAELAVQTMNNSELQEREIFVRFDRDQPGKRTGNRR